MVAQPDIAMDRTRLNTTPDCPLRIMHPTYFADAQPLLIHFPLNTGAAFKAARHIKSLPLTRSPSAVSDECILFKSIIHKRTSNESHEEIENKKWNAENWNCFQGAKDRTDCNKDSRDWTNSHGKMLPLVEGFDQRLSGIALRLQGIIS
jgi:hypothetical protein